MNFTDLLTCTRASQKWVFNSSGVLVPVANNAPAFDYDPVTLAPRGILIEEPRTNLLLRSSTFNTGWGVFGSPTITPDTVTGLDGTLSADTIVSGTSDAGLWQGASGLTPNGIYTGSVYLRSDYSMQIGVFITETAGGSGNTQFVCNVTDQWQRFSVTRILGASVTGGAFQIGGGSSFTAGESVYAWGAQLEAGAFATSHIPTTTAQVTRAADVITGPLGNWFNPLEGTIYLEAEYPQAMTLGAYPSFFAFRQGTGNSANTIEMFMADSTLVGLIRVGGTDQASMYYIKSPGESFKAALAYKAGDFAMCSGGGVVQTGTGASLPTVDTLRLGSNGGTSQINSRIRKLLYRPFRMSNSELQALTA